MPRKTPLTINIVLTVAILALFFVLFTRPGDSVSSDVPYSEFKALVHEDRVTAVEFEGRDISVTLAEPLPVGPEGTMTDQLTTRMPDIDDPALLALLEEKNVRITDREPVNTSWMLAWLPWVAIIAFYFWFQARMYRRNMGRFGRGGEGDFLGGSSREEAQGPPSVTFDDIAGQDSAKQEVAELVSFLKNPDQYRVLGAEPPRGVLLVGPPGTGKTLLARALAGEAGVPFFSTSASEFIEMFVGVGASRVRAMFKEAKKRAPSIIFIDELDSVGRVRGTGLGGGHDEREQTLNQILSEMDGFSGHEAVIVLAATNRPDILDPALLRPGRFDRHVTLDLPDRDARLAILNVHTRKVPLADDVDLHAIAAGTPGFSGADLKNLVNEAAMSAAREKATAVTMRHLDDMRDRVMMGSVRTMAILPEEHNRLATHEAGHTVAAYFLPHTDPLYKVTIIPRGMALGSTHMLPEEDRHTLPIEYLKDRLAVMLAGRAAERLLLSSTSSGAEDDIREATKLARAMVSRWGMDDEVGPVDFRQSEDHPFLGLEVAQPRRFSEASAEMVDRQVQGLLKEASDRATDVISNNRDATLRLIEALEKQETLTRAEIETCLGEPAKVVQLPRKEQTVRPGPGQSPGKN